jgi:hypothetical protein
MALATTMWHTGLNPLRKIGERAEKVEAIRSGRQRRLHKAFLRYHDPANWPLLREALMAMGRAELIGNGPAHLVPRGRAGAKPEQAARTTAAAARPGRVPPRQRSAQARLRSR